MSYRRGTTRRVLAWDVDPRTGTDLPKRLFAPVIGGVPPRSPGSTEWRRATLVALLDIWRVPHPETGGLRQLSDTEIAIVSLLTGGLDEVARDAPKKFEKGLVLREETKAINHSRRRRTLVTNFFQSERQAPIRAILDKARQQVAEATAAPAERAEAPEQALHASEYPSGAPPVKTPPRRRRKK